MTGGDVFRLAGQELARNLRRSSIAMLGLVVGVGALVALDAVGRTTAFYLMTFIERMGQARIIRVRTLGMKGLGSGARAFTEAELERVRQELAGVRAVAGRVTDWDAEARFGTERSDATAVGIDAQYFEMLGLSVREGRGFYPEDFARRAAVAILGSEMKTRLFGERPALDRICLVSGVPVRVVGLLEPSIFEDANRSVFVPLTTALARISNCRKLDSFYVEATDLAAVRPLAAALLRHLESHGKRFGQPNEVRVNSTALSQIEDSIFVLQSFVLVVGLVTLLLGGVGIMNVFLASLAERRAEIGIRKAVGATEGEIAVQILAEAALICLLASAVGVALGALIVQGVTVATGRAEMATLSPLHVTAVVVFACFVGSLFAVSPALRAARKDVVEAIRST